ncbi:MAG: hypothetical protein C4321_08290, partial [Chloroflexota bacterium]
WVACELRDAFGRFYEFIERVPVVSLADLTSDSSFPQHGEIACRIIEQWRDHEGRGLARIATSPPWSVESVDERTAFIVQRDQLSSRGE